MEKIFPGVVDLLKAKKDLKNNNNKEVNHLKHVIIELCILVTSGIVDKVVIAFLLVGHTHTDVDRIIALVVSYLRNMDIPTLDKLKEYVLRSFSPKVRVL